MLVTSDNRLYHDHPGVTLRDKDTRDDNNNPRKRDRRRNDRDKNPDEQDADKWNQTWASWGM